MRNRQFLWMVFVFCLLFPAMGFALEEVNERPQVFFEKKVYTESVGGKQKVYETHVVRKGETLWKIFGEKGQLSPQQYAERLKDFRRANPRVANPSRLLPGQELVIPVIPAEAVAEVAGEGTTASYQVRKGDTLSRIYVSSGAPGGSLKDFLNAVRKINPSVSNVDRIYAGSTLRLPSKEYFTQAPPAGTLEGTVVAAAPWLSESDARVAAKPQAELLSPESPAPDGSFIVTGKEKTEQGPVLPPTSFAYRGLLSDIFSALGEKWEEKGTLFFLLPSGEEVVLLRSDFPMVEFQGGEAVLIDFQGGLPDRVREGIQSNWEYVRVVSLEDARGAGERIDRILGSSSYHYVKEGITRPLTIGETVFVSLSARWIIQRTEGDLPSGDLVLLKETPEKPSAELVSILRYAQKVGVRVLPFADDPAIGEGFIVGIDEEEKDQGVPVAFSVPAGGGLPAVDFSLSFLGITPIEEGELQIVDTGKAFQLALQPERAFKVAGKTYVVDTGKISGAIRTILKDSGYVVVPIAQGETGRSVFERLVKVVGGTIENQREHVIAGGERAGYEVRLEGSRILLAPGTSDPGRKIFFIKGKAHSATRMLLMDLGVEIVEWES